MNDEKLRSASSTHGSHEALRSHAFWNCARASIEQLEQHFTLIAAGVHIRWKRKNLSRAEPPLSLGGQFKSHWAALLLLLEQRLTRLLVKTQPAWRDLDVELTFEWPLKQNTVWTIQPLLHAECKQTREYVNEHIRNFYIWFVRAERVFRASASQSKERLSSRALAITTSASV